MTLSRISIYLMTLLSVLIALVSYRFLGLGLEAAFSDMMGHIEARRLVFLLHVSFAPLALITGTVQSFPKIRAKRPVLHRWVGRLYGFSVLIAGMSGLIVALGAAGGLSAQLGFAILSVLWLFTTAEGVRYARAHRFTDHRRWMVRSFALTFAAVTLRLYLPFFFANGFTYTQASNYVAWMCWIPNLIAVELWRRSNRMVDVSDRTSAT